MEKLNHAGNEFSAAEIAAIVEEIQKLDARLEWLQGTVKMPEEQKPKLANALCQLASECAAIAANLIAG